MARGINKVILIGNLGKDPEVRYSADSSKAIATITLATTDSWRDRESGEQQERTEWHRVVFFNRLAEIVEQYLKKGAKIYVEGRLQTRKWQDKEGNDRYTTEIVAGEMQMLDGRGAGGGGSSHEGGGSGASRPERAERSGSVSESEPRVTQAEPPMSFDDDIPF